MKRLLTQLFALSLLLVTPTLAWAQTAENVLVVVNTMSDDSVLIGEYYAERRGVPSDQTIHITTEVADEVSRAVFSRQVEAPIPAP